MPLYYRCKSCGDEHLSPIVFPDKRSYTRSHLTKNLFVCPGTKGAARYAKPDLYWRTDLPTQPARTGATSILNASPTGEGRILIIDDEEALVWALEKLLQQAGYREIATLTDSREAVALFESFRPDVLLLDLQMPYQDGYSILRSLKPLVASDPHFPILVMTGEVQADAKLRALAEGAKDFVTKPFEQIEVLIRVKTLLETRNLYRTLRNQARMLERRQWEEGRQREIVEAAGG
jgi:PleD family two-component response regulator